MKIDKEYLNKINNEITKVKAEAIKLLEDNKIEQLKEKEKMLDDLQAKLDFGLKFMEEEADNVIENLENFTELEPLNPGEQGVVASFGRVVNSLVHNVPVDSRASEVYNTMAVKVAAEGGYLVPKDISTRIKELRREFIGLEKYVNVERVSRLAGSRVVEVISDNNKLSAVKEGEKYSDLNNPTFRLIEYSVKKFGGMTRLTYELLENSPEDITGYVERSAALRGANTRTSEILKTLEDMTKDQAIEISGVDGLKRVFNLELDPAIAERSIVITNRNGFNWLDTLKDATGKYILQPAIDKKSSRELFGIHEVVVLSNAMLPNSEDGKIPLYCGDLKEAITLFDREELRINFGAPAGEDWEKDLVTMKIREMLDTQKVDADAVKKVYVSAEVKATAETAKAKTKVSGSDA